MRTKSLPGINIQYPISRLVLSGQKTIETRTYPIPDKYIGKEMALVETPGRDGKFKSRVIGIVRFQNSFMYKSEDDFYKDYNKHLVDRKSLWKWRSGAQKWGWPVEVIKTYTSPIPLKGRPGIKYCLNIKLPVY